MLGTRERARSNFGTPDPIELRDTSSDDEWALGKWALGTPIEVGARDTH